ncbi:hypothetical protein TNCV_4749841 [Trichonephila clavipes]|nr:hypothetical protein TNCV_4749841 [Trichonephila clavipes]
MALFHRGDVSSLKWDHRLNNRLETVLSGHDDSSFHVSRRLLPLASPDSIAPKTLFPLLDMLRKVGQVASQ